MFTNGRWATPGARADVDFNWDVVQLPTGSGGTQGNWLFWGAYVVNANTEHPQEAWELVQALTTADTQAQISELGANIPSRQSQDRDRRVPHIHPAGEQPGVHQRSAGQRPPPKARCGPATGRRSTLR